MVPVAGIGEALCYSCHDVEGDGVCGKFVDESAPLMQKTVCTEGCQVRGIINKIRRIVLVYQTMRDHITEMMNSTKTNSGG